MSARLRFRELYERIAAATGETRETVEMMEEQERRELMVTLGLGNNELILSQLAAATGETMESIISMQEEEREQLVQVLGLRPSEVIQIGDDDEEDEDDEALVKSNHGESIVISDEDSPARPGASSQAVGGAGAGGGGGVGGPPGWGECPVCEQLMPLIKLELHAMACQGIHLNGGLGLEVNPMEVQSRCSMCNCLVPDLVMVEHRETCWANNSKKRRIETPMERRKSKFPKTTHWASVPRR